MFTTNVLGFTLCVGPSMLPTIDTAGELVLIDRLSYKLDLRDYKIGDVVISKSMDDPNKSESICANVCPYVYLILSWEAMLPCAPAFRT